MTMSNYFLAFLWGIYILLSLIGWGTAINHILFPRYRVDWGQRSAWGLAFSICLGGFLNFTWLISKPMIYIYLALGFFGFIVDFYQNREKFFFEIYKLRNLKNDRFFIIIAAIVVFLFILNYAGWVYSSGFPTFKLTDDYQAYFVFPQENVANRFYWTRSVQY